MLKPLFTATLLLLGLAASVLWIRTARTTSVVQRYVASAEGYAEYRLVSTSGRIGLWRTGGERTAGSEPTPTRWGFTKYATPTSRRDTLTWGYARAATADDSSVQLFGFQLYGTVPAGGGYAGQQGGFVPYWAIVLVTGGWGVRRAWKALARRGRLRKPHRCVRCGYDLTGTLTHPRCPECGATRDVGVTAV